MIIKNEAANLERALAAALPAINCWIICDTGSTDGTPDLIRARLSGLPGELHDIPFHNFGQARNAALDWAMASNLEFDYLLMLDADMELVVEDPGVFSALSESGYLIEQRAANGSLSYWNTRVVRRDKRLRYHGVTHEYLSVPGGSTPRMTGAHFIDHADGSNRQDKFARDLRLLMEAHELFPDDARTLFYLSQTLRDMGNTQEAADLYQKRADMGGWDEEAWYARLQSARCWGQLGQELRFLQGMAKALHTRPTRAESYYELARHYRIAGLHEVAYIYCARGLDLRYPETDILFVEDFIYRYGLREELSICANYCRDPKAWNHGKDVCEDLAEDANAPDAVRELAKTNLQYYAPRE